MKDEEYEKLKKKKLEEIDELLDEAYTLGWKIGKAEVGAELKTVQEEFAAYKAKVKSAKEAMDSIKI